MSETKHTATPWECVGCENYQFGLVASPGTKPDYKSTEVAKFHKPADMKFALLACNSHDALLAACKEMFAELGGTDGVPADENYARWRRAIVAVEPIGA